MSTDGAYVPLVKGAWAEVRTLAIGEVVLRKEAKEEEETQVRALTYFSRMTEAATFADLASKELQRRGVGEAKAVCTVNDGADWIQGFVDLHRPDALRILDFPHAAQHISALLDALRQAAIPLPEAVLPRSLHLLKHRGPRALLRLLERLPSQVREQEGVREHLSYLSKRESLMHYPSYLADGWPIGSGMVESANKVVVQARLKGAGMHWEPKAVNPMLALRTAVCNERWDASWQEGAKLAQEQKARWREQKATPRLRSLLCSFWHLHLCFLPAPASSASLPISLPASPAATLPGSARPSKHHPWKRGPSCRPADFAKI